METVEQINAQTELLLLKRKQLELRQKRLEIARRWGVAFYKPHPKQDAFHQAGTRFNRRMLRAGNRFGKTEMSAAETVAWLMGERIWYPVSHHARRGGIPQHPVKVLIIAQDWDLVHELWTDDRSMPGGKLWKFIPKDGFVKSKTKHAGSQAYDEIQCANGSALRFDTVKSYINDPRSAESKDWDAIGVDEPCPELMFKAHARGLVDRNGAAWFNLTPLSEAWIGDMFFPQDTGGKPRDDVWAETGTIFDNPHIDQKGRDQFIATLNEDEKQCRISGIPLHLAGLIYKQFSWQRHVLKEVPKGWEAYDKPPRNYTIFVTVDTHPRTPHAVLFCAIDPCGRRYYFRDIFEQCKIATLCAEIKRIVDGRRIYSLRIEPASIVPDPVTEQSIFDEFWRCGLPCEKASKDLSRGINVVQSQLALNDPQMIFFCPTAVRTLYEIQRYTWDQSPSRPNKPMDVDDHTMECLYRTEIQEPKWIDPGNDSGKPLDELEITRPEITDEDLTFQYDEAI